MGLTNQSSGLALSHSEILHLSLTGDYVVALAGNPNVGKSTVFNALTGLKQHTGNWPGKTVVSARGKYHHKGHDIVLVDLPGTYSLLANSAEEQVTRDFICFGQPDATVVVTDATCLERNLNLVLQVIEITPKVVVCLNLMDEAKRKKLSINISKLERRLGVPVVPTTARSGEGLEKLKDTVDAVASGEITPHPLQFKYPPPLEDDVYRLAEQLKGLLPKGLSPRWAALRILEGDDSIIPNLQAMAAH